VSYDQNALRWTSADVLADVRRKASLPVSSTDFTDTVLLREASDVLWNFAGWATSQAGEGRHVAQLVHNVVSSTLYATHSVSSQDYSLPPLAIADTIQSVSWLSDDQTQQTRLTQIDAADEVLQSTGTAETPASYALRDGRIRVYPKATSGFLRITYQRRHAELVPDTAAYVATVTSGAPTGSTLTLLTVGAQTIPFISGFDYADIISPFYPHPTLYATVTVVATTSTSITIALPSPAAFINQPSGIRVVRAGQSPYVSFPLELRAAVNEKIAANVLRIIGDLQGSQAAEQAATQELSRAMQLLTPRAKRDKPKAINPYSHLRSKLGRYW
jgi:hypothetical protein